MKYPETIQDRIIELEDARKNLMEALEKERTEGEGWSVAEIAYHLHLVEKQVGMMLQTLLKSVDLQNRISDEALRTEWERVRTILSNRSARAEAPEMVVPANAPSLEESKKLLGASRAALLEALQERSIDELASISFPHPIPALGKLSGAGWISLLAHHELRHVAQLCS